MGWLPETGLSVRLDGILAYREHGRTGVVKPEGVAEGIVEGILI